MQRIIIKLAAFSILLQSSLIFADTGLFFNINSTGPVLAITTTTPNHIYPNAAIKFNTPGYSVASCRQAANGFCLFSVSDTMPATLLVNGPTGVANAVLCLQGEVHCPAQRITFQ